MLQIKEITKEYKTGALVQKALNGVSLNLRDNEFVSILGPSGSGKTTLLNIIGGLDRYDSGDLLINGVPTKKYNARAWDSYRNHMIGFVFQSYNLIPHQSVLANVELALTIGGVKGKERRKRAEDALREVGLEEHMHKKPNQLSGGQMQRVAIARALVNDPKIVLADEPTGALDTETGIQVMEILKNVAKNRLVVMVTHNPELAEQYSTRIVRLKDGKIVGDSDPFEIQEKKTETNAKNITFGKSKMSFLTSLSLSLRNLETKKARTIITSIAGSIGIIGIALILALSSGVNEYIWKLQRDTMEKYPITISAVEYTYEIVVPTDVDKDKIVSVDEYETESLDGKIIPVVEEEASNETYRPVEKRNNLAAFKEYLEKPENNLDEYLGTGSIINEYVTRFFAYTKDTEGKTINTSNYLDSEGNYYGAYGEKAEGFMELPRGRDSTISTKTKNGFELIYGNWPEEANECILIADSNGGLSTRLLCQLGYISADDYVKIVNNPALAKKGSIGAVTYEDICKKEFIIIPESTRYIKKADGLYNRVEDNSKDFERLQKENGISLKITGIVKKSEDSQGMDMMSMLSFSSSDSSCIGYTYKLTNKIIDITQKQEIIEDQLFNDDIDAVTGIPFENTNKEKTAAAVRKYLSGIDAETKSLFYMRLMSDSMYSSQPGAAISNEEAISMEATINPSKDFDNWLESATDSQLIDFRYNYLYNSADLLSALYNIGYVSYDRPDSIVIYPDTFEGKQGIMNLLNEYNSIASSENMISYTDYIKDITDQIMDMINTVSAILIAFVAVSLIVSCIMIGIITHISVLERTKEIGILRALGASKANISQVFNAETFIIGLLSGIMGVLIAMLLCIPANMLIEQMGIIQNGTMTVAVPLIPALILIAISTFITMIGGFIPAKSASRKDPVIALRSE